MSSIIQEPVDVIITWVDGYDEIHAKKLADYLKKKGIKRPEAASPTRFNQCGELYYCVKSILKFAPWVRTIYIVTDAQTPDIIAELANTADSKKIQLVDHHDIFSGLEECLPTFNSLTIESVIWRIKGLSNNFIYFNDDIMLTRPVSVDDFFKQGALVLRGRWRGHADIKLINFIRRIGKKILGYVLRKKKFIVVSHHRYLQEKSAKVAGWNDLFFDLPHAPFALNKKMMEEFCTNQPELFLNNIKYAFRDPQQFWMISLIQHLAINAKKVTIDNLLKTTYIKADYHSINKIRHRLIKAEKNVNTAFICVQSLDAASEMTRKLIFNWLDKYCV